MLIYETGELKGSNHQRTFLHITERRERGIDERGINESGYPNGDMERTTWYNIESITVPARPTPGMQHQGEGHQMKHQRRWNEEHTSTALYFPLTDDGSGGGHVASMAPTG